LGFSRWNRIILLLIAAAGLMFPLHGSAEQVVIRVNSESGIPIDDAVVFARSLADIVANDANKNRAVIDQIDKEYVSTVTVVQKNSGIVFPNHDEIRHHVYSFSPAKTFEIPLYLGTPRQPVIFDKTGPVSLGCNIHDWMSAYIYVVDTPFFSKTGKDGNATLNLPAGDYDVEIWHYRLKGPANKTKQSVSVHGGPVHLTVAIGLNKVWKPRRGPTDHRVGGYR